MVNTTATTQPSADTGPSTPADTPTRPRRGRGSFRKWRARFIVLLLVAATIFIGIRISQNKAITSAQIDIGAVTLMSQTVPVEAGQPGQVMSVDVKAADKVTTGQQLGTLQVTTTNSEGKPVVSTIKVVAPRDGVVVDDPVTVGSTLQPGKPFAELYDPTKLTFVAEQPLKNLAEISQGMTVTLKADGLSRPLKATVERVVPRVGTDASTLKPGYMKLVMVPKSQNEVSGLVPGLRFKGTVDTGTGKSGAPRLVSVGR
jgi:multidrug resistance efflux pump